MAGVGEQDLDPAHLWKNDSIEERIFSAALMCLEAHYLQSPVMGAQPMIKVLTIITKTLEKTHTLKDVREVLSRNIRIWIWLKRAVCAAICDLNEKSLGVRSVPMVQTKFIDITTPDVTALIIKNYATLKEALQMLNKLMHIARNLLVTTGPQIPQDLSAAIAFDQEVYEAICLCVNVTSKGIDGEMPEDDASRVKLNEITELYKKVLVTSLQQAHNWIAKNDRNKMTFWFRVLIESPDVDNHPSPEDRHEPVLDYLGPRCLSLKTEVSNWLKRNSHMSPTAAAICRDYLEASDRSETEDWFPQDKNLAWNYSPEDTWEFRPDIYNEASEMVSSWVPDESDKFEQDRLYGRVSHELDEWWDDTRIPNASNWSIAMYPTDLVPERIKECESILLHRYDGADMHDEHEHIETVPPPAAIDDGRATVEWQAGHASQQSAPSYAPEYDEYEDPDDDDSYGEGPMTGLLTEVPNILDPKQIEALHMIVKSCILESAGTGAGHHGESMQKARCRILLATDCGKNLLREMLVFIAVWEKDEQSLIFQITSQIVQAIHESSLLPYAWNALRSPKDIISPAQTVLLKMITYLCRTALYPSKEYNPEPDLRSGDLNRILNNDEIRLAKMVNFLYGIFRSRIVPECVALMQIQGEVRTNRLDPAEFPVDNWDLERGKDGLVQYLDFLYTVADIYPLRQHLIEYEAVYELIKLLEGLDVGVEKIPFAHSRRHEQPVHGNGASAAHHHHHHHHHPGGPVPANPNGNNGQHLPPPPPPPPPPLADPPHEFAWTGLKGQVLSIMAALLQPPPGQSSPGNPNVQMQIVQHNGIVALLNCCLYDDNNRFCRERTQLCLKWLMDGSPDASAFLQNLVQANQQQQQQQAQQQQQQGGSGAAGPNSAPAGPGSGSMRPPPARGPPGMMTQTVRIDGVPGEVQVQVRSSSAPAVDGSGVPPAHGRPPAAIPAALGGMMPPSANHRSAGVLSASGSGGIGGSATANLDHRVSEHRSRSEELVNDLLALTVSDGGAGTGNLRRGITSEEDEDGDEDEDDDETEDDFM
ncbi:hypothetical protein Micbo1qcDRAFT_2502 [Microdochium bolleyi]|uniref:Ataxin-10 homolog n=1 Tax=Microdochium bolleyi TaxID=196109 RepID=A0A136JHT7_9PEZI|nr:hypothetical protein Micbo1qcDRAFT_2502 [Microdochium bolleyi]